MHNPIFVPELRQMLALGDAEAISNVVNELQTTTVADFSEDLEVDETWQLLHQGPIEWQAEVFTFYPAWKQLEMLQEIEHPQSSRQR